MSGVFKPGTVIGGVRVKSCVKENKNLQLTQYLVEMVCCGNVTHVGHKRIVERQRLGQHMHCMKCRGRKSYFPQHDRALLPVYAVELPVWEPTTAGRAAPRWR